MGGKAGSCPGRWTRLVWSPIIDNDSWWVQPNYFFLNPMLSWPYQNCSGRMQHFFSKLGGPRHRVVSCSCHASSDVGRDKPRWFGLRYVGEGPAQGPTCSNTMLNFSDFRSWQFYWLQRFNFMCLHVPHIFCAMKVAGMDPIGVIVLMEPATMGRPWRSFLTACTIQEISISSNNSVFASYPCQYL